VQLEWIDKYAVCALPSQACKVGPWQRLMVKSWWAKIGESVSRMTRMKGDIITVNGNGTTLRHGCQP
jgi:hypothetical protein